MDLPIDLPVKTVTTKVSVNAWNLIQAMAKEHKVRISDVLSACILHMPRDLLAEILATQATTLASMPKVVRGVMKHVPTMSEEEKALLRKVLSE